MLKLSGIQGYSLASIMQGYFLIFSGMTDAQHEQKMTSC